MFRKVNNNNHEFKESYEIDSFSNNWKITTHMQIYYMLSNDL